jgi:hypothetical protein
MRRIRLETVVNVAMLATCVLASSAIIYKLRAESPRSSPEPFKVGAHIDHIAAGAYSGSPYTLIMYVRSTCHFCTESMPFYRTLVHDHVGTGNLRLVVAAGEPAETSRSYLAGHQVSVDDILSVSTGVPTPTLVLVDRNGVVRKVWLGRLDETGEGDVKATLSKLKSS